MTMQTNRSSQLGHSLIEALCVLAIALLLMGVVVRLMAQADLEQDALQATHDVASLQSAVATYYPFGSESYAGLSTTLLVPKLPRHLPRPCSGICPAAIPLLNPFGGEYFVVPIAWKGAANAAFEIRATRVPASVCASIVRTIGQSFDEVLVNTTTVRGSRDPNSWASPADLAAACGSSSAGVTLSWRRI